MPQMPMTTPTIEQIDAAIDSLGGWLCDPNRFTQPYGQLTKAEYDLSHAYDEVLFALRFLRLALQEPSDEVVQSMIDSYNRNGRFALVAHLKAARDQMLIEVEK